MTDLKQVHLKGSSFILTRESDLVGDRGAMLISIPPLKRFDESETYLNGAIVVGYSIRCGSCTARSFQWQDYWQTTPVVSILSYDEEMNVVKFITRSGSVYTAAGLL